MSLGTTFIKTMTVNLSNSMCANWKGIGFNYFLENSF